MSVNGTPAALTVDEGTNTLYFRTSDGAYHPAGGSGAHVDLVWNGAAYPARPSTGTIPAGGANYIGPAANAPTDWVDGDTWDSY